MGMKGFVLLFNFLYVRHKKQSLGARMVRKSVNKGIIFFNYCSSKKST